MVVIESGVGRFVGNSLVFESDDIDWDNDPVNDIIAAVGRVLLDTSRSR